VREDTSKGLFLQLMYYQEQQKQQQKYLLVVDKSWCLSIILLDYIFIYSNNWALCIPKYIYAYIHTIYMFLFIYFTIIIQENSCKRFLYFLSFIV
jgi:hypothetical protein